MEERERESQQMHSVGGGEQGLRGGAGKERVVFLPAALP